MTFDYVKSRTTASRLIRNFGKSGVLRKFIQTGSGYDPVKSNTDHAVILVELDHTIKNIDGSLVKSGEKQFFISTEGLSVVPETDDVLIVNSGEHTIGPVKPFMPADVVVFYEVQLRK